MTKIDNLIEKAKRNPNKKIILAEGEDLRVLKAACFLTSKDLADMILIGNTENIEVLAEKNNLTLNDIKIIDPNLINQIKYVEFLKKRISNLDELSIKEMVKDNLSLACSMLCLNEADGVVAGAQYKSAAVMKAGLKIVKPKTKDTLVSSFFAIQLDNKNFGDDGFFLFADCGMNLSPSSEELAEIALSTAEVAINIFDMEPKIALLSHSTYGSAINEKSLKIKKALEIVNNKKKDLIIAGEIQLDAAIVPEVSLIKCPDSPLQGKANILIFPDVDSGNIGYKLVERLANAKAIGPLCRGFSKPLNDLSRGCHVEDIINAVLVTINQGEDNGF